jgi:hypothetical protein
MFSMPKRGDKSIVATTPVPAKPPHTGMGTMQMQKFTRANAATTTVTLVATQQQTEKGRWSFQRPSFNHRSRSKMTKKQTIAEIVGRVIRDAPLQNSGETIRVRCNRNVSLTLTRIQNPTINIVVLTELYFYTK